MGVDTATRIALSPAEIGFTADGTTVDGKVAYVGVVQVMPFEKGRYTWRAEGDVAWATVGETVVDESFADTWTGAVTTTRMRAVEIMATPNTEYRRSGVLTVTAEDGTVETFPITQAGLKADAEIVCELAETGIEYASAGGETTIDYTTNMGDVYDYSVTYGEPDAGEWLTWSDEGAGRVVLRAAGGPRRATTARRSSPSMSARPTRARRRPRSPSCSCVWTITTISTARRCPVTRRSMRRCR